MGKIWTRVRSLLGTEPLGCEMKAVSGGFVRLPGGGLRVVGSFLLDVRPVTNFEYAAFVQAKKAPRPHWMHRPGFGDPERPVVGVTLRDARRYARWAGKRLPSSKEWLRAAQGTDKRPYPGGEEQPGASHACFGASRQGKPAAVEDVATSRAAGVGPFGHFDLLGNVWEWCVDGVARGGFWGSDALSVGDVLETGPSTTSGGLGFRCAL